MSIEGAGALHKRLNAIGDTRLFLGRVQLRAVAEAKALVPRKTGFLGRSIYDGALTADHAFIVARAPYAVFVEIGTGIYGPKKKKIVPRKAKVLAWRTGSVRLSGRSRTKGGKQTAGWAFALSVKGRKATPFLLPGAKKAVHAAGADAFIKAWNDAA